MPRRKRTARKKRAPVSRTTQRIRKMAGQSPLTMAERIVRNADGYVGALARSVSIIQGLVNSEVKYRDVAVSGTINNTPTYTQTLSGLDEGDDSTQRNGRTILYKNFILRASVTCPSAGAPTQVGWALILDKEPDNTFVWNNVFASSSVNALVNKDETERYVILKRGIMTFSSPDNLIKTLNLFINLKGIHEKFKGTTANDVDKNAIVLVAYCANASNSPTILGSSRLNFYDN